MNQALGHATVSVTGCDIDRLRVERESCKDVGEIFLGQAIDIEMGNQAVALVAKPGEPSGMGRTGFATFDACFIAYFFDQFFLFRVPTAILYSTSKSAPLFIVGSICLKAVYISASK